MKKILSFLLIVILVVSTLAVVSASTEREIFVINDGEMVRFDVQPQIINDRTMVPMRAIYEAMGATVSWDETTQTASGTKDGVTVSMTIGNPEMSVNGETLLMDAPPVIIDGRTLAPARFVAEAFGSNVEWDTNARLVMIYNTDMPVYAAFPHIPDFGKCYGIEPVSQFVRSNFAYISYELFREDINQYTLGKYDDTLRALNYVEDTEGFENEMTELDGKIKRFIRNDKDMAEFFVWTELDSAEGVLCVEVIIPTCTDEEVIEMENYYRESMGLTADISYPFEITTTREMIPAVIEVENYGTIELELYPDIAPITVSNFQYLANRGFYDGLIFHRVIEGFMIQGGCPEGTGVGGPGYEIKGEFLANGVENSLEHKKGVISMARKRGYNSAGSQFFIMHADAPHLDGEYAAFGRVSKGMEIVDRIASVATDASDRPDADIVIKTIRVG